MPLILVRALLVGTLILILCPGLGAAQSSVGSSSDPCSGIPNCQLTPQAPIKFGASDTKGWAFYCDGNYPYYWGGYYAGDYNRWKQDNNCFTTAENNAGEVGAPNKLDVTITNWCLKDETYNISIACSSNPPPSFAPACGSRTESQPIFKDPGCPQSNTKNTCNNTQGIMCLQTWTEQCSNNIQYFCTLDIYLDLTTCTPCTETN
ncbi:hypothetical protein [Paracraurococcus lichenis]|uniref:Secreted protein n=1 Tax=Paracraurococcus lichenis TaxID=3064888 RepID=A0ABT9DZZ9_9PROT|nr:hypothetical protein [Paracraurococcus sp. LOR1-02]MDO9709458.1 hypothetical protein [Paracraurococcus sp. LOR1-02]